MLEHVAGLEVLIIEPGCFAIAPFADGFVGGQEGFHWIVSLVSLGNCPLGQVGLRTWLPVHAAIPAAASVRRALRATASSIISPSTVPTPLAFTAITARAFSTASALGVSAALIGPRCAGCIAALAPKPSATAAVISCLSPASSSSSKNGESIANTSPNAQAAISRLRAKASGCHAVAA